MSTEFKNTEVNFSDGNQKLKIDALLGIGKLQALIGEFQYHLATTICIHNFDMFLKPYLS